MSTAGERRFGGLPGGKVSILWELHGAEDRRTGGEEDRRKGGQDFPALPHSTLPEPRGWVGTGISSAVVHVRDRRSQCRCRGGGTGVPGSAGMGVSAQPVPVPGSAMGTSVSSVAAYAGQALQGAMGMGSPSGARGQDWRSRCCPVGGDGAALVGTVLLVSMEVSWVGWVGGRCWGDGCVGPHCLLASGLA